MSYSAFHPPLLSIDPTLQRAMASVNVATMFGLLGVFAFVYGRAAKVAETALARAHRKAEELLHNILPAPIAARLQNEQHVIADGIAEASVLFADIVGFTPLSERVSPEELVALLNRVFSELDDLVERHDVEKIKTIGDAYMVAAGIPSPRADHAAALVRLAMEMVRVAGRHKGPDGIPLKLRIGINSGHVVAGVIGKRKFIYDLWGDTVNIAARMESHGRAGSIQITDATRALLGDAFRIERRGLIDVKGKGRMQTWWVLDDLTQEGPLPSQGLEETPPPG